MRERSRGGLSLVATPIGNLEDITIRALRTLREADVVFAEDTRRTRTLLRAHEIDTRVERLDEHTMRLRLDETVDRLRTGTHAALVTDAGTPMISDPGGVLVRAAIDAGVSVDVIPGPSAPLAALLASGVAADGFRFVGFLPRDGRERSVALAAIARDPLPTVLFESPMRTHETLRDLSDACGAQRQAAVAREMTKLHEEVLRGALEALVSQTANGVRGEVTLVVSGAESLEGTADGSSVSAALDAAFAAGMRPSDAAKDVARALGLRRADVYALAIERSRRSTPDADDGGKREG